MNGPPSFDPGFSTPAMTEVWTAASRVKLILQFEASLALALADAGLAAAEEAEQVAAACRAPSTGAEQIVASAWETGTPLLAIVAEIKAQLSDQSLQPLIHFGATSQDAIDTAQMLAARESLTLFESSLVRIAHSMRSLIVTYRDQPQIGRTFLQHARPTTLGMRVTTWLEPLLRDLQILREVRAGLAVQLGGPVGTGTAYGEAYPEVTAALAKRLGLVVPPLAWHSDRSRIRTLVRAVEEPVLGLAKVALDLALLAQTDTGEVTVRGGGSSSMAEKRNPIDPIRALAAADACRGAAAMITQGRPHELDRGLGAWQVEWLALPLVFHTAAAAGEAMERALASLEVHSEQMAARVTQEIAGGTVGPSIDQVLTLFEQLMEQG